MGLSCGMKCLKYVLFAFNFIFWIAGIAVFGVGIWSRIKSKDWDSLLGDDGTIASAANLMIAAGAFVMVIGFIGCCGALKESKFLLITYAILLMLIFVLEIAAGIYAYTKKDSVLDKLKTNIRKSVHTSYGGTTSAEKSLTKGVDWFQKNVDCCGSYAPSDWTNSTWYSNQKANKNNTVTRKLVPETCCVTRTAGCSSGAPNSVSVASLVTAKKIHTKGCVDAGEKFVKDHMWEVGGVGVGVAFLQLFGIVVAIMLCRALNYENI